MKLFFKTFAGISSLFIVFLLMFTLHAQSPYNGNYIMGTRPVQAFTLLPQTFYKKNNNMQTQPVQAQVTERKMVIPGGCAFGIKMHTRGIIVVGMSDIQNGTQNLNPAKDAGLKVGDILTKINDMPINRNSDISRFVAESEGGEVKITAIRGDTEMDFHLTPVKSEYDEGYKAGIWVRDSSAGIGTMTYYNPETLGFGGLGHAVCDIDTGDIMPLFSGEIVDVNISGVNIGQSGKPGELKGNFASDEPLGYLYANSEAGIFGVLHEPLLNTDPIPMAMVHEIKPGPAQIYSTVSGNKPQAFDIEIEKVNHSSSTPTKNMVIRVVDHNLLSISGGIVQGMSGSPIIQDGKLAGAVTHVFVNDPTRGYGIFAENMDSMLKQIENNPIAA